MYICVFLALRHFLLFQSRVFPRALGFVARREPARTSHARFVPGRGPWHVIWGFKVASPLGKGFRARRAIQALAHPRKVKRMSGVSCDIWDLECHQCRQTIRTW